MKINSFTKSAWQSKTLQGVALTVMCAGFSLTGRHVDKDLVQGVIDNGGEVLTVLGVIIASLTAAWGRIKTWKWERPNLTEPGTWTALITVIAAVGNALHLPTEDLVKAVEQIGGLAVGGKLAGVATSLYMLYGAIVAKKDIRIEKADRIPSWMIAAVSIPMLTNCSAWNRLSPEQQARIEQQAIAAATAAATTAAQGVLDGKKGKQIAIESGKAALEAVKQVSDNPTL